MSKFLTWLIPQEWVKSRYHYIPMSLRIFSDSVKKETRYQSSSMCNNVLIYSRIWEKGLDSVQLAVLCPIHKVALNKYWSNKCIYVNVNMRCSYCRTIFTNIPRYNYVDPEFAYTDSEKLAKKAHEDHYDACIKYISNVKKKER